MFARNKKIKKGFKKIWLPIMALSFVPLAAHGEDVAPKPSGPRFNDLTVSELASTFRNFEARTEGADPNNRATLYGMVFDDCKGYFDISNTTTDATLRASHTIGFHISDVDGKGRQCMASHKGDRCSAAHPCSPLSKIQGASMDLSGQGDAKIQLVHVDPDRDRDQNQWEDFADQALSHTSAATIRAQREAEKKRALDETVSLLKKQVSNCRKSTEDRDIARQAAQSLLEINQISQDALDKLNRDLDKLEFNELSRKFLKTSLKDEDGAQEILEQLKAFEADHPESSENIAALIYQRALAYAKTAKSVDAYDKASAWIGEAQGLTNLSDTSGTRLENYQRDIAVGRFQMEAQSGNLDPYTFTQSYSNFMWDLQSGLRTCSTPQSMQGESCKSMMQAYRTASQIPQQAQQAQMQQQMFYMQMQQQTASFMSNGMGGNTFTNGGMPMNASPQGSGFYR